MKKGLITLIVIGAILLGGFIWVKNVYNQMVVSDESVQAAWSQVENVYQRRANLIPNLVSTVKDMRHTSLRHLKAWFRHAQRQHR